MIRRIKPGIMQASSLRVAVIVSVFNSDVTQALQTGALDELKQKGCHAENITVVEVPGAREIALVAQRLAQQKKVDVIIALGAVIRGETTHYEDVCQSVTEGCLKVSLDYNIPVIVEVLMTENEAQAWARVGGAHGHKGRDAVRCAIMMHDVLAQIEGNQ